MTQRIRNSLIQIFMLFAIAAAGACILPRAHAGLLPSEAAQTPQTPSVQAERERAKALLARPEVAKQLGEFGVAAGDVPARVDAMTDAEVLQLAGKIDQLTAGGAALTNDQLIVILLLVIILVLVL